jgi:hypothetical protein
MRQGAALTNKSNVAVELTAAKTSSFQDNLAAIRRDMAISKWIIWFTAVGVLALLLKAFGESP